MIAVLFKHISLNRVIHFLVDMSFENELVFKECHFDYFRFTFEFENLFEIIKMSRVRLNQHRFVINCEILGTNDFFVNVKRHIGLDYKQVS